MPKQKLSDLPVTSSRLKHLASELQLSEQAQQRALILAKLKPDSFAWIGFIDRFLLLCGTVLLVVGVMAFFAYNWTDLHKFAKFALIECALVASVLLAFLYGIGSQPGKMALFSAAVLTGVLLAVYGQTYQTGADPYGLFLTWAVLICGWVVISRNSGLWLLLLILLNLSVILFWTQIIHPEDWSRGFVSSLGPFAGITFSMFDFSLAQWVFSLNVLALIGWEFFKDRNIDWMHSRLFPRIVAVFALGPIVISTLVLIFSSGTGHYWGIRFVSPVFFVLFVVLALYYYRKKSPDMFILSSCLLAVIVIVTSLVARIMNGGFDLFLLLSILVIVQSAAAARWLRNVKTDRSIVE